MSRVVLKKHHRALIPYFKKHSISAIAAENSNLRVEPCSDDLLKKLSPEQMELVTDLLGEMSFDPEKNPIDASALYATTGLRSTTL